MAISGLFSLLVLALVTEGQNAEEFNGTCYQTSDTLSFSKVNAHKDIAHVGESETIFCCANNFDDNVRWFREDSVGKRTEMAPTNNYNFLQHGQQLTIHKVSMADNGIYICEARSQTHTVTFNFNLTVVDCALTPGRAIPRTIPPPVKYAAIGDTFSLECSGYFLCGRDDIFNNVDWLLKYDNGGPTEFLKGNNSLYSVTPIKKDNGTQVGSLLTFKYVTEENFTTQYICDIMAYDKTFPVKLRRKATTEIFPLWSLGILVPIALFIVLSVMLVYGPYGSQAVFWLKTKLNCGWPARKGAVTYDVCLLTSPESEEFVSEHICEVLRSHGYSMFYPSEETGEGRLDAYVQMEGLTRSSHVLLYLSSDEEVERIRQFFVESCVQMQGGSKIIIIHKGPLGKSLRTLRPQIQSKLKIVKSIQWPKNTDENSREMKNFWCSVRLGLPASRTVTARNARYGSTSSTQPLQKEENQNLHTGDAQGNLNHHV